MPKDVKLDKQAGCKMVRDGLKLCSYKLGMGHYLDERMKRVRLQNARSLLKNESTGLILFMEEKVFTNKRVNHQNDCELLQNSIDIFKIFSPFRLKINL